MYKDKQILALIPARGGSKGIKGKNITDLSGKPLIAYTIEASLGSRYIDHTIVTTDDDKIAEVSRNAGAEVPFLRPKELASDTAKTIDAVLHAIKETENLGIKSEVLVLLQPTQPLRTSADIDGAIQSFFEHGERGVVSVSEVDDHPLLVRTIDAGQNLKSLLGENSTCRRQDMDRYLRVNGAIYINKISELDENSSFNDNPVGFVMEKDHSVDIDEPKDLVLAKYYLEKED